MGAFLAAAAPLAGRVLAGLLGRRSAGRASEQLVGGYREGEELIAGAGQDAFDVAAAGGRTASDILSQARGGYFPYTEAGEQGARSLADLGRTGFQFNYQDFANDPAFAFLMREGRNAIENSASARGGAVGGNVLRDLTEFGQGLAATQYQQAFDRARQAFGANVGLQTTLADIGMAGQNRITDLDVRRAGSEADLGRFLADLRMSTGQQAAGYRAAAGEARAGGTAARGAIDAGTVADVGMSLPDLIRAVRVRNLN